jgi:two-component system cell cycle response regulator
MKLLVVDDEALICNGICRMLAGMDCVEEIRSAFSGPEALEIMRTFSPDMVLSDILMPGMNGLDLCQKVKDDPRWSGIPIMIVTSATNDSDLADGFWKLGTPADAFVSKPFDPFDMADRVERMIRNRGVKDVPDGTA